MSLRQVTDDVFYTILLFAATVTIIVLSLLPPP